MSLATVLGILLAAAGMVGAASVAAARGPADYFVYISSSKGNVGEIALFRMNAATGSLTKQRTVAKLPDPNFLALSADRKFLYATSNPKDGAVVAFSIDGDTGELTRINEQPSGGHRSVHVSLEPTGRAALVANYIGNTVAALGINVDGSLSAPKPEAIQTHAGSGPNAARQAHPFPHSIYPDPSGRFAYSCDLGTDRIYCYTIDAASGMLAPSDPPTVSTPPGSGPRHLAFSIDRKHAYVICEMGNILLAYDFNAATGALKQIQEIPTLPAGITHLDQQTAGEVQAHPNGKFLYASNRGPHSSIALYSIDAHTGQLTPVDDTPCGGQGPRYFGLDPTGTWLLVGNQLSDNVAVFHIDDLTNKLKLTGEAVPVSAPMCVVFFPVP